MARNFLAARPNLGLWGFHSRSFRVVSGTYPEHVAILVRTNNGFLQDIAEHMEPGVSGILGVSRTCPQTPYQALAWPYKFTFCSKR